MGRISVYDRTRLLETAASSAYELVRRRSLLYECPNLPGELCRTIRGRVGPLLICIDEQRAPFPITDLQALSIDSVVMAELYGPTIGFGASAGLGTFQPASPISAARGYEAGQVRLYTRQWMTSTAGLRSRALYPAVFGC